MKQNNKLIKISTITVFIFLIFSFFLFLRNNDSKKESVKEIKDEERITNKLFIISQKQNFWFDIINSIYPLHKDYKYDIAIESMRPFSLSLYPNRNESSLDNNILFGKWIELSPSLYLSPYAENFDLMVFSIWGTGNSPSFYERYLQKSKLFEKSKDKTCYGSLIPQQHLEINKENKAESYSYRAHFNIPMAMGHQLFDDDILIRINKKYENNIKYLKKDTDKIELHLQNKLETYFDSKIFIRNLCSRKYLGNKIISSLLDILIKSQIKKVYSIDVFEQKQTTKLSGEDYLRVPIKLNLIINYAELKRLVGNINDSKYLMYVSILGIYQNNIKQELAEIYKERSLFGNASCEIVIDFVTSLENNQAKANYLRIRPLPSQMNRKENMGQGLDPM